MVTFETVVVDEDGSVVMREGDDAVLPTASVGKLWLLAEVAEGIETGRLDPRMPLRRPTDPQVADSGLWQFLSVDVLPLVDAAVLTAAVSDNSATNALLDVVSLAAVAERAESLGASRSRLHDRVRDARGPDDEPLLSTGVASELAGAARRIHAASGGLTGVGISPGAARRLEAWLRLGVDTSMVLDPLHLDPLAHVEPSDGVLAWGKTGSDPGVRAEVGVVARPDGWRAYAAIAVWPTEEESAGRHEARRLMRDLGRSLASSPST